MNTSVVGLDIGTSAVRAVEVVDAHKRRPTLVRYREVALPEGAVVRGEVIEPNTVAAAVKQLWSGGGFKSKDVVLGMGNHRVLARDMTVPKATMARIRESLPTQVQDMLPVPVEDAILDFYPISELEGEAGPEVHGLLIAAVKEAVLGNIRAVQLAGLNPVEVDLIPFALTRVVSRGAQPDGAIVQVDVGAGTTSVVISLSGVPQFVRLIPTGGDDVTQALVSRFELNPEQAEALKRTSGLNTPVGASDHPGVAVTHEVTSELLNSLRNTVTYFTNTRRGVPISAIVLTGGGAQLLGFGEALSELTRLPVRSPDVSGAISLSRGVDGGGMQHPRGAFLVALGLALRSAA